MLIILKHPVIKGDYNIEEYKNCVRVHNFSFAVHRHVDQKTGSSQRNIGLPKYEDISFTRKMDSSTIAFKNELFSGNSTDCEIIFLADSFKYIMSIANAILSSYQMEAETYTEQVIEHIKINYTNLDFRQLK